jgi:type IV pilus assembly protein PilB
MAQPNEPVPPKKPAPPAGSTPPGANGAKPQAVPSKPGATPPAKPGAVPPQGAKPGGVPLPGAKPGGVPLPGAKPAAVPPQGAKPAGQVPVRPGTPPPTKPLPPKPAPAAGAAKPGVPAKPAAPPAKAGDAAAKPPPAKKPPSDKPAVSAKDHKPNPVKQSTASRSGGRRMGQVLVDLGYIDEDQLWEILDEAKNAGVPIGQAALSRALITEPQLLQALAEQFGLRLLTPEDLKPTSEALAAVNETMASVSKVLPLTYKDNVLTVAVGDPVAGLPGLDTLRSFLGIGEVVACLAPPAAIAEVLARCYLGKEESIMDIISALQEDDGEGGRRNESSIDLDSLIEMQEAAPVRKLLNMVMLLAIKDRASDIHFEPFEDEYKIRMRCDGVMYEMVPPPRHLAMAISTRIKVMSNLDIAERRLPQDGRIELNVGGNSVDMRVSILPTLFGESAVIRVLDRGNVGLDLNRVGMDTQIMGPFRELIQKPNGITLVTGPTGSGKTTTLYSALSELNEVTEKIITCEDPVEYDIDGIIQVPINSEIGVTFANVLRAILRQDPDKILVGEIRDLETAQIAVQAALTGHMVFSTLHTNDAPSTITRLRDMGLEPFLITATVEGILAQRLVRRICEDCRTEFEPSDELMMELQMKRNEAGGKKFFYGRGCDRCNNTGYKSRMGLYELVIMNDELRDLVSSGASTDQLRNACRKQGMSTLREAGLRAVFDGFTTIEEVVRETILDDE